MAAFRVLIPVNRLDRAKGRLAELLSPEQRSGLALATLATVLDAVRGAGGEAFVLTADERVAGAARGKAHVIDEAPGADGLNAQLERAVSQLAGEELLILHADLPLAEAEALAALIAEAPPAASATLVESPDGGTNAMLLRPPGRFALAYGRDSAALHREAAGASGVTVAMLKAPALRLDMDTPADVAALLAMPAGRSSPAGLLLLRWGIASQTGDTKKG